MPQKQKTPKPLTRHKPVKKKTPPASSLSKLHWNWKVLKQTLLIILGLGILFLIALNRYHAHQTHLAQQAQLTRLNAASTDLKKVYDQLLTTLPNIREHSFEKSCGRASDTLENGIITCGAYGYLLADQFNTEFQDADVKKIEDIFSDNKSFRPKKSGGAEQDPIYGYTTYYATYVHSQIQCGFYVEISVNNAQYDKGHHTQTQYTGSIRGVHLACDDAAEHFLPGYTVEK